MPTFLTPHFTLEEMLTSQTATRFRYFEQFDPPITIIENLRALCEHVLEPIRLSMNRPIHVSSGYRCERLNKKIGGAKSSQHMQGQAADIQVIGIKTEDLFQFIRDANLPYDQIIQEFDSWVHISYKSASRNEALIATKLGNGRTVYTVAA
tara:strand:- start:579 stop:1031 length:453 start_codon:yes stop_codon:yes gene_type:complete